jgi:hypothetical protein
MSCNSDGVCLYFASDARRSALMNDVVHNPFIISAALDLSQSPVHRDFLANSESRSSDTFLCDVLLLFASCFYRHPVALLTAVLPLGG